MNITLMNNVNDSRVAKSVHVPKDSSIIDDTLLGSTKPAHDIRYSLSTSRIEEEIEQETNIISVATSESLEFFLEF